MDCSIKSPRAISFLAAVFFCTTAGLGQFVVNTADDTVDMNPGNGICADVNGNCSLRAAIMEANSTPGANDIFVPNNTYIIGLDTPGEDGGLSGDLDITSEVVIVGESTRETIINADSLDRVFHILPGGIATIEHLEIQQGFVYAENGGALLNQGELTLSEVGIRWSMAEGDGEGQLGGGLGGAIYNDGVLTIDNATINGCKAQGGNGGNGVGPGGGSGGGAGPGLGGALYNASNATAAMTNSTVSGNIAVGGRGGNGSHHQGSGVVSSPGGPGGGAGGAAGGPGGNGGAGSWGGGGGGGGSVSGAGGAAGFGGGGGGGGASSWGGDSGPGGDGGLYGGGGGQGCCSGGSGGGGGAGLGGGVFDRSGGFTCTNCTFAFNEAVGGDGGNGWFSGGGAAGTGSGGAIFNLNGSVIADNCLFAENTSSDTGEQLAGELGSIGGHNLVQTTDAEVSFIGVTTADLLDIDPLVYPLSDNGGNTDTHMLESCNPVSPAIDAGNDDLASDFDQIGQGRNEISEIGALEVVAAFAVLLPVDTALCEGQSLLLDVTTPDATYIWDDGSTGPTLLVESEGTYGVAVSLNGCNFTDEVLVEFGTLETIDLGADQDICPAEILLLDPGALGGTYLWQDDSSLPTFTAEDSGTYWVLVTLGSCSAGDTVIIGQVDPVDLDLGPDLSVCQGEEVVLNAGVAADQFTWSTGENAPFISVGTSGNYQLTVEVGGCEFSDQVILDVVALPAVDLGPDIQICLDESLVLDISSSSGQTYLWQDGSTESTFAVLESGDYSIEVQQNGCSETDEISVVVLPVPVFELGPDLSVCQGEEVVLNPGVTADQFTWSTGETTPFISIGISGNYHLTAELNGCTFSDQTTLEVVPLPWVDLGTDIQICFGEVLVLDASSSGQTYLWQDGSTESTFAVLGSGNYSVEVQQGGCLETDEISVLVLPVPVFELGPDTVICHNEDAQIQALVSIPEATLIWSTGESSASISPHVSGTYTATSFLNGCAFSDEIYVEVIPSFQLYLGEDVVLCQGLTYVLDAWDEFFYYPLQVHWNGAGQDSVLAVTETGLYQVEVTSICESKSDEVRVEFELCDCQIFVPNSFTPDNDGLNDAFQVSASKCHFEKYHLWIMDRNGDVVFESDSPDQYWDGSFQQGGHYVTDGVYVWRMAYTYRDDEGVKTEELFGHITILR
jgi:gliding motility-associated-like protein/CSLREA domain-containing protein